MSTLRVINEAGELTTQEVVNREAIVSPEDRPDFSPAVVQRIEYDHKKAMSQITTVCGESENRQETDEKPDLTVEGIVTKEQLEDLKLLDRGDRITFVSDVDQGEVIIHRITIEQNSRIVEFIPNGGEPQLAFSFQLQLKRPE